MENKNVVITGVLGQTGSYMAEFLLDEGYVVYGLSRPRTTGLDTRNVNHLLSNKKFRLVEADIMDHVQMCSIINNHKPLFFFNFAALSHVGTSFEMPIEAFRVNAEAVVAQLDSIRRFSPETRYYQASTSEIWGGVDCPEGGYNEESVINPRSPYAVSKAAAYYAVRNYRESYGLYAASGILFNHESPRRAETFATRKITKGVANIIKGNQSTLKMGCMTSFRDIGHAKDYVRGIWLMMNQPKPEDYCVGTGQGATIKEMLEYVCSLGGLSYEDVYEMNPKFMRPSEVNYLLCDASKIRRLGWVPEYTWKELLKEMFENDLKQLG